MKENSKMEDAADAIERIFMKIQTWYFAGGIFVGVLLGLIFTVSALFVLWL